MTWEEIHKQLTSTVRSVRVCVITLIIVVVLNDLFGEILGLEEFSAEQARLDAIQKSIAVLPQSIPTPQPAREMLVALDTELCGEMLFWPHEIERCWSWGPDETCVMIKGLGYYAVKRPIADVKQQIEEATR